MIGFGILYPVMENMFNPLRPFKETLRAVFVARPNRFLVLCDVANQRVKAYLPNPGRLQELLLPETVLHLVGTPSTPSRKTSFTVVAVEREGRPIMLHTHRTNDVARYLLEQGKIAGLAGAEVVRPEVAVGHSRFDFLLKDSLGDIYLEVKSCTLVSRRLAMFPDAVTARGARHLLELEKLSRKGSRAAVLFIVHWPDVEFFMPDYHTDLLFAETLLKVRNHIQVIPVSVEWQADLSLSHEVKLLRVPWDYLEREAEDRGSYLLILHVRDDVAMTVGSLGRVSLRKGFYIYVGSAMANLTRRLERHLRMRKQHHWHIDVLRDVAEVHALLPIRSSTRLECDIAKAMSTLADWTIPDFGSSDCRCPTHLFAMKEDPLLGRAFHDLLQYFRMDRGLRDC
jgi:sugar fermentation stimulation protein A